MDKFICNKCNFLLTITKTNLTNTIKISTPNEFINALKLEEVVEYDLTLERKDLEAHLNKKNTSNKESILKKYDIMRSQKQIISKYNIKCTSCGENYILHPETVIYSMNVGKQFSSFNDDNLDLKMYDPTLPRTKDYICPNSKCETNEKNFNTSKKEAVFYRASKSYHLKYACLNCETSWNI
jgi:hypothetical protein